MTPLRSRFAPLVLCLLCLATALRLAAADPPAGPAARPQDKPAAPATPANPATPPAPPAATAPAPVVRNIGGPGDYPLREKLIQRLTRDPDLAGFRPSIVLVNGGVVFSGPVPSWSMRRRALATAGAMRGVVNVTDQMTVPRGDVKDEAILKGIVMALTERKDQLQITDLDVTVQDGVATLNGGVKDFASRVLAEEVAGTILGAQRLVNRLRPANAPSGTDDVTTRKALAAYLGDFRNYAWPANLEVQVKDGVATLGGEVGLYLGRQQAGTMAALVGGVKRVENRIKVEPSLQQPDAVIKEVP
jgi:osmotically-inducible protein OsmY